MYSSWIDESNFFMESWLDSTAHDQTQLAMQNSALFRVYRALSNSRSQRTRIRFSLGREPCPYTQMFRSASIMTRTRSSSVTFASYTSFPRSHVFPPIFSSTIVPINENKDGCSTSSDRSRSPWRHLASLVSFFFAYTWPGNGTLSYPLRSNTRPAIRSSPLPRDPIVIARLVITS